MRDFFTNNLTRKLCVAALDVVGNNVNATVVVEASPTASIHLTCYRLRLILGNDVQLETKQVFTGNGICHTSRIPAIAFRQSFAQVCNRAIGLLFLSRSLAFNRVAKLIHRLEILDRTTERRIEFQQLILKLAFGFAF